MKLARKAFASLALLAAGSHAQGLDPIPPDQLFERLSPSVWTVETYDGRGQPLALGSGVVVGLGSVVTNCHVLAKASRVAVARDNVSYGATLEHPDPERDLCLLKVRNFKAPAAPMGTAEGLRVGSRVYAIGSPRGLEQTISDGLLSGVRRSASDEIMALQITVPISRGSSGGGLFDARGRLVGITTFQLRDGQNLNFAVPANWIAEVPERAKLALAARSESGPGAASGMPARGQVFEYELRDKLTGAVRTVTYRLDRVEGDKLVFNEGSRIERANGAVVSNTDAVGGEFDIGMPPGGWVSGEPKPGMTWQSKYKSGVPGLSVFMELEARALSDSTMRLKDRELRVLRVEFTGFTTRGVGSSVYPMGTNPAGRYTATAWYAPELNRVVRFEVETRGGQGVTGFYVHEQLQLVDIRSE